MRSVRGGGVLKRALSGGGSIARVSETLQASIDISIEDAQRVQDLQGRSSSFRVRDAQHGTEPAVWIVAELLNGRSKRPEKTTRISMSAAGAFRSR
jgi:hypothetical protein